MGLLRDAQVEIFTRVPKRCLCAASFSSILPSNDRTHLLEKEHLTYSKINAAEWVLYSYAREGLKVSVRTVNDEGKRTSICLQIKIYKLKYFYVVQIVLSRQVF